MLEVQRKMTLKKGKNKLDIAAFYNSNGEFMPSVAESFLKTGGNINDIDTTANETLLMHAAHIGNLRLAKRLLALGADVEVKNVIKS
jgi:ankyrin repeat protein